MMDSGEATVILPRFTADEQRLMLQWAHEAVRAAVTGAPSRASMKRR